MLFETWGTTNVDIGRRKGRGRSPRFNGFCHDAAGNLVLNATCPTGTFTPTYSYDIENRLTSTNGWSYVYDGDGERVKKCNSCATSAGGTLYWPSSVADTVLETDLAGTRKYEYMFFNGERIARRDGSNPPYYYFSDHLKSTDVVTNSSGATQDESDYFPYGGEIVLSNLTPQNYKFNGKERDSESGLDDFGARYHSSGLSRFMTPDWAAKPTDVPYANFGNPQSLNLFSYVQNNPTTLGDPDGHDIQFANNNVEQTFDRIGNESQSFRSEIDAAKADHTIDVTVEQVGARKLPDHALGDATAYEGSDGRVHMTIRVQPNDERTTEHEVGHEKDARTNRKQFFEDARKDAKAKGGPNEKSHDDRPVEKRANQFKDKSRRSARTIINNKNKRETIRNTTGEMAMGRSLLIITFVSFFFQPWMAAQNSSLQGSSGEEAVAAVRQEFHANFPLRAAWVPSLGDDLIFLKIHGQFSPGAEVPLVTFYQVTIAPYALRGNKLEQQAVQVDNDSEWLVAIDQESGQKYLLLGANNPTAGFNTLIQRLHVRVGDTDTALAVFDFFLKTVPGAQSRSRVVGDSMKLQSVALQDFRSRLPAAKSRAAFDRWWNGLSVAARQGIKPPQAQATKGDFVIRYTVYDRGSLRKEILRMNADGTVIQPTVEVPASTIR